MATNLTQDQLTARLQLVEEHLNAENDHDVDRIMQTFGANPTFALNGDTFSGRESIRGMYEAFGFGGQGGFSNIQVEARRRHVGDQAIVLEAVLHAEHTSDWQGIPATGKKVEVPLCAVFPFDGDGKLAGETVYLDGAMLLKQLGVL